MNAEILSTGDEIRIGSLVDTNSAYIARSLFDAGLDVTRHACVGDNLDHLVSAIREIADRADIAIMTGGLGPTVDDLTSEALARAAGVRLELNPEARDSMQAFFRKRNRIPTVTDDKQALLPVGAECLVNPVGTAPGIAMTVGRCRFFCLPGVPREMEYLMTHAVLPMIHRMAHGGKTVNRIRTFSLFGLPEALVDEKLKGIDTEHPDIRMGLQASFPVIYVKLYASGEDRVLLEQRLEDASKWTHHRLDPHIFSETGETMEEVIGRLLVDRNATIAVAESCTGGLIGHMLTSVSGSSSYFLFSAVTYANTTKTAVLGVPEDILGRCGAVSEETAMAMAQGVRRVAGTTYGLSVTGIAGPAGGTDEKPVGTVCIGLAGLDESHARRFNLNFRERSMNKSLFAMAALDMLRRKLLGIGLAGDA